MYQCFTTIRVNNNGRVVGQISEVDTVIDCQSSVLVQPSVLNDLLNASFSISDYELTQGAYIFSLGFSLPLLFYMTALGVGYVIRTINSV